MIKFCEDVMNTSHDTRYGDVRCILLIEDSVRFYSRYLPMLYTEVLEQTQSLMEEGLNLSHRLLRLRARPKILLAGTFEEAWDWRNAVHIAGNRLKDDTGDLFWILFKQCLD